MKTHFLILLPALCAGLTLFGQDSPVLLTIGDSEVTLEEFERIYKKNNTETSLNQQSPEEYLDLFINFKLKVMEAESLGMDTTSKFIQELEGYREQLAEPYLTDNETREELMREAYERSKIDINASHILIKLPPNPTPKDTLAAYEKISAIRERVLSGEPFDKVARATSDDSSVKRNGGNLNYFTAFSMIYPFENVAYSTPVGEVSEPFRTDYGYHFLKVHDRRPARGQVKVAHIFVRSPEGMPEEQKEKAYEKAQMIYDSLQMGKEFAYMARTYSEDPASARNGGEIPWFGTGRMIPEFEDASFALEQEGEYTKPFRSSYGWHIIQLKGKKGIGTYEEMKPELQQKSNRGDRKEYQVERYVNKLKKEYGFSENRDLLGQVYPETDSTLLEGNWEPGPLASSDAPLFSIGGRTATLGEFTRYMEEKQAKGRATDTRAYTDQLYTQFTRDEVIGYEESRLAEKYPEFRHIYQEYHDGILLFDIMDQKVWSRAVSDTAGLEAFYNAHKKNYMWDERKKAVLVTLGEGADIDGVRKKYNRIRRGRWDEKKLNDKFCASDTSDCISLETLLVLDGEHPMVDELGPNEVIGPVRENEDGNQFVILQKIVPPQPKALDEVRGQVTSDYQNYLEEQWIEELRDKYRVEVNRELLSRIE